MNSGSKLRRRDFLRLSVVTASGATLAACAGSNVLPSDAGAVLGDGTIVFNMYAQPSAQGRGYMFSSDPVVQLDQGQEFPRNTHQLDNLRAMTPRLSAGDSAFGPSLEWAYREYIVRRLSAGDGDTATPLGDAPAQAVDPATRRRQMQAMTPITRPAAPDEPRLCLFNVLVALEWLPDQAYLRQLEWAFRRASDFLYDVTDGMMAFGQVVLGGPELMDAADIQIMASNRLLPRSWVSGLHIERKYMPIRMGRGVWHKNNLASIPWDEPEAYRTLIHEWGHYALELRDGYLEQRPLVLAGPADGMALPGHALIQARPDESAPYTVVMPRITQHSESIMATTEGKSELITHAVGSGAKRKSEEWSIIQVRFPWLKPSAQPLEGPGRLPLPLPRLQRLGALAEIADTQQRAALLLRSFPEKLRLDDCWVYVLPASSAAQPAPERVIAQGTLEARSAENGFPLLGAGQGVTVVLIGKNVDQASVVVRGLIDLTTVDGQAQASVGQWHDATPRAFPKIAVVPDAAGEQQKVARISIQIDSAAGQLPEHVWLFPLGQARAQDVLALGAPDRANWSSAVHEVPTLDGHVLLRWKDGSLMISSFSQGGDGPNSGFPYPANPMNAGSADGNALLFMFKDNADDRAPNDVKVVTTLAHGLEGAAGGHERGYAFGIAVNRPLPAEFHPTLLMYYDQSDEQDGDTPAGAGDLAICRRTADGDWERLPTYLPPRFRFAVAPLDTHSGGALIAASADGPRVEYYKV
ncbi:MAG: hypothetical protein M3R61_15020, partial [Chloroflexota bacterium]|nr:hypothetical protein [Chloroflexota bacterium]